MIVLHHLNRSRSKRIIWLLELLEIPYQIKAYQRDPNTHLAPPELKKVHPLGKSPVIEEDGLVIAESGAIIEYLTEKYGKGRLAPPKDAREYPIYLQWLHFAESSAALPLLLCYFLDIEEKPTVFLDGYSKKEFSLILGYLDSHLHSNKWLMGDMFTAADIMLSFIIEMSAQMGALQEDYPALQRYLQDLGNAPAAQRASELEQQYDASRN